MDAPSSSSLSLRCFTQSATLRQIGHRRLARFLNGFDQDLKASGLVLPQPDPAHDDYFADLATKLAFTQRLPQSLRKALFTLEEAASPENEKPLGAAIKRRIPCVSVSADCALDRALELWFSAPDELSQFLPAALQGTSALSLHPLAVPDAPSASPVPDHPDQETFARLARLTPAE